MSEKDLYKVNARIAIPKNGSIMATSTSSNTVKLPLMEWHVRLGHLNEKSIIALANNQIVTGILLADTKTYMLDLRSREDSIKPIASK